VNCDTQNVDPGVSGSHPDFHQANVFVSDVIMYSMNLSLPLSLSLSLSKVSLSHNKRYNVRGVHLLSQGFFGDNATNCAFVSI
jgi:hypothetical protein